MTKFVNDLRMDSREFATALFEFSERSHIRVCLGGWIEPHYVGDTLAALGRVTDFIKFFSCGDEQKFGRTVFQNVLDLRRSQGGINRNRDGAREQAALVGQDPFDATL